MKAFDANEWMKGWAEGQKSLFGAWAQGKAPPFAFGGGGASAGNPMDPLSQLSDLMRRPMEQWAEYAKGAWGQAGTIDPEAMKKLFDPAEWKRAGSHFDMGMEKLTEGPTFATLWDLDRKMLELQKLWGVRAADTERYWEVVQRAWSDALGRFTKSLSDSRGEPITSGRQLLDLWLATANKSLVEMHRSEKFLEAQRKMTRSAAEYRLAEREIAEAFCEAHHIPTRTEVDELQRTVAELRRELRALKRKG